MMEQLFFKSLGMDLKKYSNIIDWLERCKTIPGYLENQEGGIAMKELFNKKLVEFREKPT